MSGVPLNRLSKWWDINRESLRNHKQHISPALIALHQERTEVGRRKDVERLEDLIAETDKMYESAKKVGNMGLALKAVRKQRANLELHARLTRELDERPQVAVNVQAMPQYIEVRSVIFSVLEPHPEIRRDISRRLRLLADNEPPSASA